MVIVKVLKNLPDSPGVYIFRDERGSVLYVGKAASLRSRVRSYFQRPHDVRIDSMVSQIARLETKQTRSSLEALFLESELIKKYQPKYNVMSKDDKTFAYIAITKEPIPRILVVRPTDRRKEKIGKLFGPYQSAAIARTALKILRRIFPFHSLKTKPGEVCFHASIGMCPGVCAISRGRRLEVGGRSTVGMSVHRSEILRLRPDSGRGSAQDDKLLVRAYRRTLMNIEMFLKGKRTRLEAGLKRQMKAASRAERYEEAARLRDSIQALRHINDVALLKQESGFVALEAKLPGAAGAGSLASIRLHRPSHLGVPHRIEAYDVSHTFGHEPVGSMVVFTNGKVDPSQFRKFRIRGAVMAEAKLPSATRAGSLASARWIDDTAMLKQVLTRRLKHKEWPMPDLFLMDGGAAQLSAVHAVLKNLGLSIPAAALAKGPQRKRADLYTADSSVKLIPLSLLVKLREQAHRFAIRYHRTLRARRFLEG